MTEVCIVGSSKKAALEAAHEALKVAIVHVECRLCHGDKLLCAKGCALPFLCKEMNELKITTEDTSDHQPINAAQMKVRKKGKERNCEEQG